MDRSQGEPEEGGRSAAAAGYLARVDALAPVIAAAADEAEAACRLPDALMAALHDAGLFRLLLPRAQGGAELDPPGFCEVIEAVARHDASTAWCLCQASGCTMVAAYLDPAVADRIFGSDPRAVLAWGPGPGRAVAAAEGYRLTGSWSFASGGRHATWLGGVAPIFEADGAARRDGQGAPVIRTFLFPAASATMTDIWNVIGLRGTGSDAFAVTDLLVPAEYAAARDEPAERRQPGPLYCFTSSSLYAAGFAGVALGVARSVLDGLIDLAGDKTPRGFRRPLRESGVIQAQVAQATARLDAARLLLLTRLGQNWRAAQRQGQLTLAERINLRLAATFAIQEARWVADTAYEHAGATAIFTGSVFERRFRDMHAVTQQVQGRQSHFETVGQFLLGLEPDPTFL